MTVNDMLIKMIQESNRNTHDIAHFLKVYTYAKLIGEKEGLDETTQKTLETAAVIHDIACPLCREKYLLQRRQLPQPPGAPRRGILRGRRLFQTRLLAGSPRLGTAHEGKDLQ